MTLSELLKPARRSNESFEAYKIRRCVANETIHEKKEGILFYESSRILHGRRWPYLKREAVVR